MIVNKNNLPHLAEAFRLIELDNGGHLIGTVYPGEKIDLDNFEVPDQYYGLCVSANAGLSLLNEEDLETFTQGEHTRVEGIAARTLNLSIAHRVLNMFFDGWPE